MTPRPEWAPGSRGRPPCRLRKKSPRTKWRQKKIARKCRVIYIEAQMNNIDLKLAKNYLLPTFDFSGGRMSPCGLDCGCRLSHGIAI